MQFYTVFEIKFARIQTKNFIFKLKSFDFNVKHLFPSVHHNWRRNGLFFFKYFSTKITEMINQMCFFKSVKSLK